MTPVEHAILKTVVWFSLFETPVTVFEIWKWMLCADRAYGLEEVYAALEGEGLRGRLEGKDGFWTVVPTPGIGWVSEKNDIGAWAEERRDRFLDATRKYAKLKRAARYFALVPTVESVSAANTLAWWNTRPESDIDLYVTVRPGAIWTTRLLMVAPFALLGKRPGATELDPFCFSFFATTDAPPLSSFALPGGDPYLDLWVRSLVPVYARTSPNPSLPAGRQGLAGGETRFSPCQGGVKRGYASRWFESIARKIQMRRLPMRIKRVMNADTCVVVTDQALKFHENDRREEYRDRWGRLVSGI